MVMGRSRSPSTTRVCVSEAAAASRTACTYSKDRPCNTLWLLVVLVVVVLLLLVCVLRSSDADAAEEEEVKEDGGGCGWPNRRPRLRHTQRATCVCAGVCMRV